MKQASPTSRIRLGNASCAYCHKRFQAPNGRQDEHVIGKKFVPKGSLAARWNLIVNACAKCNAEKCGLENDLSAIVMRPDPWGRHTADTRLVKEAHRKETAMSRRTGKAVRDSGESLKVNLRPTPSVKMSVKLVAAPQFDHERAERLAFFHVAAFFYLITYDENERRGSPIPGSFCPVATTAKPDWGNAQTVGFQQLIANWPVRVIGIGADTFFKIVIRRSPLEHSALWAWALEWNHHVRIIGFFGDGDAAQATFEALPVPEMFLIDQGIDPGKGRFQTLGRREVALAEGDDHLFVNDDTQSCTVRTAEHALKM